MVGAVAVVVVVVALAVVVLLRNSAHPDQAVGRGGLRKRLRRRAEKEGCCHCRYGCMLYCHCCYRCLLLVERIRCTNRLADVSPVSFLPNI